MVKVTQYKFRHFLHDYLFKLPNLITISGLNSKNTYNNNLNTYLYQTHDEIIVLKFSTIAIVEDSEDWSKKRKRKLSGNEKCFSATTAFMAH